MKEIQYFGNQDGELFPYDETDKFYWEYSGGELRSKKILEGYGDARFCDGAVVLGEWLRTKGVAPLDLNSVKQYFDSLEPEALVGKSYWGEGEPFYGITGKASYAKITGLFSDGYHVKFYDILNDEDHYHGVNDLSIYRLKIDLSNLTYQIITDKEIKKYQERMKEESQTKQIESLLFKDVTNEELIFAWHCLNESKSLQEEDLTITKYIAHLNLPYESMLWDLIDEELRRRKVDPKSPPILIDGRIVRFNEDGIAFGDVDVDKETILKIAARFS